MQVHVEGWPALLTDEAACRYLSIERAPFVRLADTRRISPVEVEPGTWRWRKQDLDKMIKWLPVAPVAAGETSSNIAMGEAVIAKVVDVVLAKVQHRSVPSDRIRPQALSILETAKCLGISRSNVYKLINEDSLQVRKIGRRTLVLVESIEGILQGQPVGSGGA